MELLEKNRTYHEAQESMALLPNYFAWTYGKFRDRISGVVIELGCGAGLGIPHYADRAEMVYAVDHNPALLKRVQAMDLSTRVETVPADLLDDWSELDGVQADTVIMMDVLEHFRDDGRFLGKAASLLRKGGTMIVKVPAQSQLYSSVDEASGHFRRYDKTDLERLAKASRLEIRAIMHINPMGALAYRMRRKRRSNFSKTFAQWQLKLINAAIPLIKLGDLAPLLPGLSLVCVMERHS